jgi:hypothetical protein
VFKIGRSDWGISLLGTYCPVTRGQELMDSLDIELVKL